MKAFTISEIKSTDKITEKAKAWAIDNIDYLNKAMALLTTNSTKTLKGEKLGVTTAILYLQPAGKVSAVTLCAGAKMAGCENPCLISSGQLGMSAGQSAATKRTILYVMRTDEFMTQLQGEVSKLHAKHGESLAVRLNGTSDIDWSQFIASNPDITFYDYTKRAALITKNDLPNYDLTFSGSAYSPASIRATVTAIHAGARVVLAFNTKEAKGEYKRPSELADFDETDLRFMDRKGIIGALKRKGSNKEERAKDETGKSFFFTRDTYAQLINAVNI